MFLVHVFDVNPNQEFSALPAYLNYLGHFRKSVCAQAQNPDPGKKFLGGGLRSACDSDEHWVLGATSVYQH